MRSDSRESHRRDSGKSHGSDSGKSHGSDSGKSHGSARRGGPVRRRDRRGRGLRGVLAPHDIPISRTRSESFDDLVVAAVDELEEHWATELAALEFAVEDVPPDASQQLDLGADAVVDRGVVLGRLFRDGLGDIRQPVIVVYRRPVEARAVDRDDGADLVFMIVVDLVAEFLGKDIDELDPPH